MVIFFLSSVESCGCEHGVSSREEDVCSSSPKKEWSMTLAIFLPASVESCGGDHGISSREEEVCHSYSYEKDKDDHGHFPAIFSGEF